MLSEVQKEEWKQKAAEEMRKHRELYPDYRFNPAPKGSRKAKGKDGKDEKDEENTRKLRETYVGMTGPAPMGSREKRKQNSKKNKHFGRRAFPLEVSFQEYRPVSDAVPPTPLAYGSGSESGSRLPPNFPQPSYPHLPYDQLQHPDSQYPTLGHPASETPLHTAPKSKSSEADSTESGCGLRLDPQITPNDQWYQYGESMLGSSTHTSYEQYQEEYQGQFKEQLNNNNNNDGFPAAFSTSQQEPLIPVPATATFDDQHTTYYYPQLALENWDLERGDAAQYDVLQNYYASLTGFSWSTPGWEFNGWQPC
ncbi:hypothetical protein D9758_001107 [Tetrapyrgos nigripes]|uniref:Uncharacterized protein n=1 Tax=Tetrapyrgos nigripes TaxID=182062 RepID=A0A8H5GS85_9AGAR|nr:hypothetical protein D9758_001107 [Tetrapyrgos nigripes]